MVRSIPSQCCVADEDPPEPQDQGQDVAMADTISDCAPHGGQDQDGHQDWGCCPTQKPQAKATMKGSSRKPADINAMKGDVPPKVIKRQECKHLLERISFSVDAS